MAFSKGGIQGQDFGRNVLAGVVAVMATGAVFRYAGNLPVVRDIRRGFGG